VSHIRKESPMFRVNYISVVLTFAMNNMDLVSLISLLLPQLGVDDN